VPVQASFCKKGFFRGKPLKIKKNIVKKKILKQKKPKKKRKRMEIRKTHKSAHLRIMGVNAAGIKCKLASMDNILKRLQPQIWTVQETKLKPNETMKLEAANIYQIYYLSRQDSQGGGLAIGINKDIESALVREGDDDVEALVVQVVLGDISVRIIVAYGPQENAKKDNNKKVLGDP
jgi:hypothetical protein